MERAVIELTDVLKMTVSLLAIVEPFGIVPFFLAVTQGWPRPRALAAARTTAFTVLTVLVVSVFAGEAMLGVFGISLASFSVGGGLILLMLALSMLRAQEVGLRQTPEEAEETAERNAAAVVPMGVPLLAGPGAISNVIIQSHQFGGGVDVHVALVLAILFVALVVAVVFSFAGWIADRLGTVGVNLVTRLMGLILAALAVEMMARGLSELFPGLAH
ncbi:MAG: NAAT family transporter [Halothiobacillaceae bacterium]|nr:MAG: NAAT family transporter [Halothiobacillaceae bacterium]